MAKCECGCGEETGLARQTSTGDRWIKGQPLRFVAGHNLRRPTPPGVYKHVRALKNGALVDRQEHAVIAERALGKPLPKGAQVHHVDEDPGNNSPRNLVICQNMAYHKILHLRTRVVRAGGNPNTQRMCNSCVEPKDFSCFYANKADKAYGLMNICRDCARRKSTTEYWRKAGVAS